MHFADPFKRERPSDPSVYRDAAFLSQCRDGDARDWLKNRPVEFSPVFGTPRTPPESHVLEYILYRCQRRLKIRPKGGAKDCHLGWWSDLGVRLGVGDAVRGFFGGSGQRSHAELKRPAPAGRPQGGTVCRVGVSLATRALEARRLPGPRDGVPQFSYRRCFCGRGSG